jgi:hypothetical protein
VVAVVVAGPALTVPVGVAGADEAAAVLELLRLVEVAEWLEPPQAARTSEAITAAQSACRGIGAL